MGNTKTTMGLVSCILVIIGACIGSAIFSISGMTIWYAGGSAIISWIVAALIYALYGLILSELSGRYPDSGGIYNFPKRAIGGTKGACIGFFCTWGYILSNLIAIGFSAIYVGVFLQEGFPSFCALIGGRTVVSVAAMILTLIVLLLGGKLSQNIQNGFVIALIATMLTYCGFAFFGGCFDSSNFNNFFNQGVKGSTGFITAIPLALVAYGGSAAIAFLNSEVKNAKRNVPLSIFLGLICVAAFYSAIIIAIVGTLPHKVLCDNETLRYSPIFATISNGGLRNYVWMEKLVAICGIFALLTTMSALLRVNARAMQAVATQGFFPKGLYRETHLGVPSISVIVMGVIALVLCFLPHQVEMMIRLGAVLNIVSMTIICLSLIFSRKQGITTGFKAPAGILIALLTIAIFIACYTPEIKTTGSSIWLFTQGIYSIGLVVYIIGRQNAKKRISGIVVKGKGHGHIAGMPTANLEPFPGEKLPERGVWKVKVLVDGNVHDGLTNVGLRPTDDASDIPTVETYILNFNSDIYGKEITLAFVEWLRETKKFENLNELKKVIDKDVRDIYGGSES